MNHSDIRPHFDWDRRMPHSIVIFAARITLPHFSVSSDTSFAKSADEPATTTPPSSANRACALGSARPTLISWLSLSMTAVGVFFGRTKTNPVSRLITWNKLAHGWYLRQYIRTRLACHRQCPQLAGLDVCNRYRHRREENVHLPTEEIGNGRSPATKWNLRHVDAGHVLEQLAREVRRGSVAGRRHVDLSRISVGIGDEFGQGLGWNRRINHDHEGCSEDANDRSDVANEIEIKLLIQRRVNCRGRVEQKKRIAVRR